jgi:hypothetical protein
LLELGPVDPTYHLVFDDGSRMTLTSNMEHMERQLEHIQPGSFKGLQRYLDEGRRHYDVAMERLVNRDFRRASEFFSLRNLPLLHQVKPLQRHYANMRHYFDDPRLKAAFTFQDVYMGLSPFEAPATFSMMSFTELAHGAWYPRGGMYSMSGARRHRHGRPLRVQTEVQDQTRDFGAAWSWPGVFRMTRSGKCRPPWRLQEPPDEDRRHFLSANASCSVISFFWAWIEVPALSPHTLFLATTIEFR